MRLLALLPLLLFLGCDSGSDGPDGPPSPPGNLDPNVAPMTEGDWYRPAADVTWQWQLDGPINTGYDVDMKRIESIGSSPLEVLQNSGGFDVVIDMIQEFL